MRSILLLVVFIFSMTCAASDLPDAPNGYEWYTSKNGVGIFLQPNGWFVLEEQKNDTNALFITKEKIENGSRFITGITVNQINTFSKKSELKPSLYAQDWAVGMGKKYQVLHSFTIPGPSGNMYGIRVRGDNNGEPTILHFLSVGNNDEDKVYSIIFETPESLWESNFEVAKPVLNGFGLGE